MRVYKAQGLIRPLERANGYRAYDQSHVETLQAIKLGQPLGVTLKEIKYLTEAWNGGTLSSGKRRRAISEKLRECKEKRAQLDLMIGYLGDCLDWVDGGEIGDKTSFAHTKRDGDPE